MGHWPLTTTCLYLMLVAVICAVAEAGVVGKREETSAGHPELATAGARPGLGQTATITHGQSPTYPLTPLIPLNQHADDSGKRVFECDMHEGSTGTIFTGCRVINGQEQKQEADKNSEPNWAFISVILSSTTLILVGLICLLILWAFVAARRERE